MEYSRLSLVEKSIENNGEVAVLLTGESMKGLIPSGTKVKIVKKKFGQIRVSEIVAFKRNGDLIVHQCVFKSKNYLVTWGVNNNFLDGKVLPDDVLGTVDYPISTTLFQNLLLIEAKKINKGLKRLRANPIWLKGPIYNLYLYGYFLQGKMSDLDVLIDRHSFQRFRAQMEKMGYVMDKRKPSKIRELPYAEISFFKTIGELTITIDVHLIAIRCSFRRFFPAPIEPDRMMRLNEELVKNPNRYREFTILNDTSSLVHLCLNTMFHHAGRGVWEHARISQLIGDKKIEWRTFREILIKYGLTEYSFFPLMWSKHLFRLRNVSLSGRIPSKPKRLMVKLLVNRLTVCRLIYMNNWFSKKINTLLGLVLRLIISLPDTRSHTADTN